VERGLNLLAGRHGEDIDQQRNADQQWNRPERRAVATLPEKYPEAVILYYFQSMDLAAAAHSLNMPEGTL